MATGKFMQGLKGSQPKTISAADIDDIADKLHETTSANLEKKAKEAQPPVAKKTAAAAPAKKSVPVKKGLHRLTLDVPDELFEKAQFYKQRSGVTLKGLVVALLYDFFEEQEENTSTRRSISRPR